MTAKRPAKRKFEFPKKPKSPKIDITCKRCGKIFQRVFRKNFEFKFCSESCRAKAWRDAGNDPCEPLKKRRAKTKVNVEPTPRVEYTAMAPRKRTLRERAFITALRVAGVSRAEFFGDDLAGED